MSDWFLTSAERGNLAADIDRAWSVGNSVRLLVDGAVYTSACTTNCALAAGDRVHFTDWRGDADKCLVDNGPSIGELLVELARNGVEIRGML